MITPVLNNWRSIEYGTMRKVGGFVLVSVGVAVLAVYGIVRLRLPLPAPAVWFVRHVAPDGLMVYVDPVITPVCAGAALISGILMFRSRS